VARERSFAALRMTVASLQFRFDTASLSMLEYEEGIHQGSNELKRMFTVLELNAWLPPHRHCIAMYAAPLTGRGRGSAFPAGKLYRRQRASAQTLLIPLQLVPSPIPSTGNLPPQHILKQRYRIICQVGKGGMGAVYRAGDVQLNDRAVAVKEMSQSGLNPFDIPRATGTFKQEAIFLAGLMHANLPRIYDHFTEDGRWYLIMDFIEGHTMAP